MIRFKSFINFKFQLKPSFKIVEAMGLIYYFGVSILFYFKKSYNYLQFPFV